MKKLLVLTALLAAGAVQAEDIHWEGNALGSGGVTTDWNNSISWYNASAGGADKVPGAGDIVAIQKYAFGNDGFNTDIVPVLNSASANLGQVFISWNATGTANAQSGQLDLVSGAVLTMADNLQMGLAADAASTATLNMSGNAQATANGLFMANVAGGGTATINMNGTSLLTILIGGAWGQDAAGQGSGSVVMDAGAVLRYNAGSAAWANERITALNSGAGDSIQATDIGGGVTEYTVIPEPATLGLVGLFGGAILFIRRKFMI